MIIQEKSIQVNDLLNIAQREESWMKYRTMGKLGIQTSAFGLGCMRFNGAASGDSVIDEQKAISLIRRAIDGGVTYLDTAYVYLDRTSEIVLGKALQPLIWCWFYLLVLVLFDA